MTCYFPPQLYQHRKSRQAFAGYGQIHNVMLSNEDCAAPSVIQQYNHHLKNQLQCLTPSLPMRSPNVISDPLHEPCMQEFTKKHQQTQLKLDHLYKMKNKVANSEHFWKSSLFRVVQHMKDLEKTEISGIELEIDIRMAMAETSPWFPGIVEKCADVIGEDISRTKVNTDYEGGSLSWVGSEKTTGTVCFASGPNLGNVIAAEVCSHDEEGVSLGSEQTINLDNEGQVYQIETRFVHNEAYGVARQANCTSLFRLTDASAISLCSRNSWLKHKPLSVCLNQYIPAEYVIATDTGSIFMLEPEINTPRLICANLEHRFPCRDNWRSLHWGDHARQIVATDRTAMDLYDIRIPDHQAPSCVLFELPAPVLHKNERIMASSSLADCNHHIVATDYSLMLVDRRFPGHPALHWSHCMLEPPAYVCSVQVSSDTVILLGSQLHPELHCFPMSLTSQTVPPVAQGVPWRASSPRDFAKFGRRQGMIFHPSVFLHKLDLPLAGITGCSVQNQLTVFQITSHGDLFQQTYTTEPTADSDLTYNSGAGSENLGLAPNLMAGCKAWLEKAEDQISDASVTAVAPHTQRFDASEMMSSIKKPGVFAHVLCSACMPQNDGNVAPDDVDECFACCLSLNFAKELKQAVENRCCMPQPSPNNCQLDVMSVKEICAFSDHHSKLYHKLWHQDFNIKQELETRDKEILKKRAEKAKNKKRKRDDQEEPDSTEENPSDEESDSESKDCKDDNKKESVENTVADWSLNLYALFGKQEEPDSAKKTNSEDTDSLSNNSEFVSEYDVALSLGQKQKSTNGSLLSRSSRHTTFSSLLGFSQTPMKLRRQSKQITSQSPSTSRPNSPSVLFDGHSSQWKASPFGSPGTSQIPTLSSNRRSGSQTLKKRKSAMGF